MSFICWLTLKGLQQLELGQNEARSFFQLFHVSAGTQHLGLPALFFPAPKQGAGSAVK